MVKKWIFTAIALIVIAAFWFAGNKSCESRLSVINASGTTLTGFEAYAADKRLDGPSPTIPAGGHNSYAFSGFAQGAYIIRFTDAEGIRIEDSQGHLDPAAAYHDTLMLLPADGTERFRLRQATSACKEHVRLNYYFRRLIRDSLRNLIRSL